ncbi:bifunctional 2',3'-cyclic-nucleotide 2'-phosphodiesterase/3'-nucleotidase [Gymnodinialimonas ceratoperidinii]|uniref:Bifunctional 2',3'-cyclic-nucleotide 2'-phosphodiesterase/3'-nucleotidase n=1 Tax=Gymnodinialimonas ceratoperidinii TaxID=2856823 RepID=A0A8F6YDE6_9RHOB|nr:bifunctional 2',3'-cyclic-nucleotide 2'-phosphodiesterase/3'-nucleotidase [Gymnodinialimonas ceratoperidinii]QXT40375.1 bifunctional 2',3'-cyclic-nucleotide 2'-phosphodiesterase/3'-nucleotidase [Gymnodinialimonas ceratoperidinii]
MATAPDTSDVTVQLKVLATTDLHAHLLPFDYFTDRRDDAVGLAHLGAMIASARASAANVLLLDNGDTLQGAPLADASEAEIVPAGRLHPMIAAMNALGYDAGTVGNHDFDFGVRHLLASLKGADFPIVSANARCALGHAFLPSRTTLAREVTDSEGRKHPLRIGITGAVPPQVALWNKPHLQGRMAFDDIVSTLRTEVAQLRAEGADLVLVLAHSGYGSLDAGRGAENVAAQVARIEGVDGVVAGHTHRLRAEAAECLGDTASAPIVQPGAFGSHLGCIDLTVCRDEGSSGTPWRVQRSEARNVAAQVTGGPMLRDYPELRERIARDHKTTRAFVARPLGHSAVALETYFSVIAPCAATQVIADAQFAAAAPLIAATPALAGLPVLSAAAPFKAGGRSGSRSYTDVPAGPLRLRHAADLYTYPNMLSVLRITGQGVRDWLERSASLFHQIDPASKAPQPLIDHDFAPYNFDRLVGLRYQIDVSRPPRTNAEGDEIRDTPGRIRNLTLADGTPLRAHDEVLVIGNSYRAAGGGHMRAAQMAEDVVSARISIREAVASYIAERDGPLRPVVEPTFSFVPLSGTQILFETGPGALRHPERLAALGLTPGLRVDTGFQPFKMTL